MNTSPFSHVPAYQEGRLIGILGEAVSDGMAPFRGKKIFVEYEFGIDRACDQLIIEVVGLGWSVTKTASVPHADLLDVPELTVRKVAHELVQKFRNRETFPIETHIYLGEN